MVNYPALWNKNVKYVLTWTAISPNYFKYIVNDLIFDICTALGIFGYARDVSPLTQM